MITKEMEDLARGVLAEGCFIIAEGAATDAYLQRLSELTRLAALVLQQAEAGRPKPRKVGYWTVHGANRSLELYTYLSKESVEAEARRMNRTRPQDGPWFAVYVEGEEGRGPAE